MSGKKKDLICTGNPLAFIRNVHVDLNRLSNESVSVLEDIQKDCSRVKKYKHEYAPYTDVKNAFILRVCDMSFTIIITRKSCIVIDFAQLIELDK